MWQRGERGRRTRLIRTDVKFPVHLTKTEWILHTADVLLQRESLVFGIGRGMTSCVSRVWNRWNKKSWIVYVMSVVTDPAETWRLGRIQELEIPTPLFLTHNTNVCDVNWWIVKSPKAFRHRLFCAGRTFYVGYHSKRFDIC
jgi:hypothetical protein